MSRGAFALLALLLPGRAAEPAAGSRPAEWRPLFNGRDLTGWHVDVPSRDTTPSLRNPFIVRGGHLVSLGTPEGHLITDAIYANYRLDVSKKLDDVRKVINDLMKEKT